jgi:FlaA1/EpsC-like NDP-sugar epimerase
VKFIQLLFQTNIPRWIIFFIDLVICFFSIIIAFLVRFNFSVPKELSTDAIYFVFYTILGVRFVSFLISRTYKGIIKHTSSKD